MGKRRHSRPKGPHYTPLASHRKDGSKLRGPLAALNAIVVDWLRDVLPEYLWIAALADDFGLDRFHLAYNEFMDALDTHWSHKFAALGLISDFGLVPESERTTFIERNRALVDQFFNRPIGRILSLYPAGPANWLVRREFLEAEGPLDPFVELGKLRRLVLRLVPGKDRFCGRIRALPLRQLLKHRQVAFSSEISITKLLPLYPTGITDDEQYKVEALVRSMLNGLISRREVPDLLAWPKYFWRHNYDLLPCRPELRELVGAVTVSSSDGLRLADLLQQNARAALEYLDLLRNRLRPDLYDPRRDEVLFGLFARVTRLYVLMADDPFLWARDVSGVMLRPLVETAITLSYLAKAGTAEDFQRFIEYGEGQQKLLMLHLQDNYPKGRSLDGLSSEELGRDFEVWPEVLDIELGHWSGKDARWLAQKAGLEEFYRLVFTPASSDLHGSWLSLKSSNLVRCAEPLHRWHRLPTYAEPPFFVNTAIAAQKLYEHCRDEAVNTLGYPVPSTSLHDLTSAEQTPRPDELEDSSRPAVPHD